MNLSRNLKLSFSAGAMFVAMQFLSGCGGGSVSVGFVPVVILHNGIYGYYTNSVFCSYLNNYCGTGSAYGIGSNGCFYNGNYCDGGFGGGSGSGGGSSGGTTGNGGGNGGGTTGNGGGSSGGGTTGNGGGSFGGGSSGGSNGGGSFGGGSSGGGSFGGGSSGGSNGGGSFGGGSSGGSNGGGNGGGSFGGGSSGGSNGGGNGGGSFGGGSNGGGNGGGSSLDGDTTDVDLQRANLQVSQIEERAVALQGQIPMSIESARQLTQLADKMNRLSSAGTLTDQDRAALAHSALGVTGIKTEEIDSAMASMQKGDHSAVDGLMNRAATNMGMPSSAALRDQILPSLGINLN